jgi:hypothetical protein
MFVHVSEVKVAATVDRPLAGVLDTHLPHKCLAFPVMKLMCFMGCMSEHSLVQGDEAMAKMPWIRNRCDYERRTAHLCTSA